MSDTSGRVVVFKHTAILDHELAEDIKTGLYASES